MDTNKKAPAITIQTVAFNVEKYIEECIENVLNQSFTDFEWLILDNGCTDGTSDILQIYSKKDARIKLYRNDKNTYLYNVPFDANYLEDIKNLKSEYWCILDSDDYFNKDFLKELYEAAKEYDADIAVAGSKMFMDGNAKAYSLRCPPNFYTKDVASLGDMLSKIYGSFRPIWGKIFKVQLMNRVHSYRDENPIEMLNGGDTVFCLDSLGFANSVIGINKPLYNYRMRQTSHYHSQINTERYIDYIKIHNESIKLLKQWNRLNETNLHFVASVLYSSMKDCMDIAASALSVPINNRLEVIEAIICDEFIYKTTSKYDLLSKLLEDLQNSIKVIINNASEQDLYIATTHFSYRLYKSIEMGNSKNSNIQNAFLLYISSICDEINRNRIGTNLVFSFLSLAGKRDIAKLEKQGISSGILISNPTLLREIINSNFEEAIKICELNIENLDYALLKQELQKISGQADFGWIIRAKEIMQECFSREDFDGGINWLVKILEYCPLDKEALSYKLYILTANGDLETAIETAEVLRIFYPGDSTVLSMIAQAYANVQLLHRAEEFFQIALDYCIDETQREEILNELAAIKNK